MYRYNGLERLRPRGEDSPRPPAYARRV